MSRAQDNPDTVGRIGAPAGAAIVLGPGQGRRFWNSVSNGTVKVESGAGDFSVFESSPPPGGTGPAPHVHRSYDEAWLVLEGTMRFLIDGAALDREAGAFVFVPRGVPHAFANPGPGPARILVVGSPPVLAMVEELGRAAAGRPPDRAMVAAVYERYDSELRGN